MFMKSRGALVTGAGRRIGRAIALELASRGYDLVIHYNTSEAEAESVADSARECGVAAKTLGADLLDSNAVSTLIDRSCGLLGKELGVLVNNASIFSGNSIVTATGADWNRHIGTNLHAPFVLVQGFSRQLTGGERDDNGERVASGNIINLVDQRVLKPTCMFATYTIAKMALWDFTRTAAISLAPDIRVNAIGPGPTLPTPDQSSEHFNRQRTSTILKRGTNPGDITRAVGFILDSPSLTGQLMCVDGGQHLR